MDVYAGDPTPTGLSLDARVGGSPFNVATGLARLGRPTAWFGALSSDVLGQRLDTALRTEGVNMVHALTVAAPTTLSIVGLDANGSPSYSFHGEGCADRAITIDDLPDLDESVAAIHVGSFSMMVDPIGNALLELVGREADRRLISYDPNLRLMVQPDRDRWIQTITRMAGVAHLIKVSEEDLTELFPGDDPRSHIDRWLASGASLVVLTQGSKGAIAFTPEHKLAMPGVRAQVVDTVGAGDSFQAAMLAWLAESGLLAGPAIAALSEQQLGQMLTFAMSAAAITCSRRGADLPFRRELP